MKRFFLFCSFAIAVLYSGIIAEEYQNTESPNPQGEVAYYSAFNFAFHPGIFNLNDTLVRIYTTFVGTNNCHLIRDDLGVSQSREFNKDNFVEFSLTAKEALSISEYDISQTMTEKIYEQTALKLHIGNFNYICYVRLNQSDKISGFYVNNDSKLGSNYIITSYQNNSKNANQSNFISIVGVYDDTKVIFKLGGSEQSKVIIENGDTLYFGQTIERIIHEGDVWLIPGQNNEPLTGSNVIANKPVSVFSGSNCDYIEGSENDCNYTMIQELPANQFQKEYLLPVLHEQDDYPYLSIVTKDDSTNVYFDGIHSAIVKNNGLDYAIIKAGEIKEGETSPKPIRITSDNPINVVLNSPAATKNDENLRKFNMQILPTEFTQQVDINIVNADEEYVNLIYTATIDGNIPNDIKLGQVIDDVYVWRKLNEFTTDSGERFNYDLENDTHYRNTNIKFPRSGTYSINTRNFIAAYQNGIKSSNGFGHHLIASHYDEITPDSLAPVVEYIMNSDCEVDGIVTDAEETEPDNRSNLVFVSMDEENSYNYLFEFEPFVPTKDSSTTWTLRVIDPYLDAKAKLFFYDRRGNRTDTIIECKSPLSVLENEISKSFQIQTENGKLKFFTQENFHIEKFEIYDLTGNLVLSQNVNQSATDLVIDVMNYTHGVYIIKLYINNVWISKKVMI